MSEITQNLRKLKSSEALKAIFLVVKYFPQVRDILENAGPDTTWQIYASKAFGALSAIDDDAFIADYLKFAGILLSLEPEVVDNFDAVDIIPALGEAWVMNGLSELLGTVTPVDEVKANAKAETKETK